jgi:curli biogenesis system outer membrane secretion channel CsgG
MKKCVSVLTVLFFLLTVGWGCETVNRLTAPKAQVTSTGGQDIAQAQLESYNGPRARIAVARFSDKTGKGWWTGEIGDGMADMLATALFNTNRFIVLERQTLQDVLAEQDLGASGRVRRGTAAPIGRIEGAELLVTGAVTEFEPGSSGVGGVLGAKLGSVVTGILSAINKSHVAIDIRIIDTTTSRIVAATSVEGKGTDFSLKGLLVGNKVGGGLGGYSKTPVEKAVALSEAVKFIASRTPNQYFHYAASNNFSVPASTPSASPGQTVSVIKNNVNIRSGPGTNYRVIGKASKGEQLKILEIRGSWYHIEYPAGNGWIYKSLVR